MKSKRRWLAWLGVWLCLLHVATVVSVAVVTTDESTAAVTDTMHEDQEETERESTRTDVIPQVSWWAKLLAGIGLGPLVAIAGAFVALITSAVVIAIVCGHDYRKRRTKSDQE